jgi:hypothetical protein
MQRAIQISGEVRCGNYGLAPGSRTGNGFVRTHPKTYLIDFTGKVWVRFAKFAFSSPRTPFDAQPGNESLSQPPARMSPRPPLAFWTKNRLFDINPKNYLVDFTAKF